MEQSDRIAREGDRVTHLEECWHCSELRENDEVPPWGAEGRSKHIPDDDRAQNTVRLYECFDCGYYWERWRPAPRSTPPHRNGYGQTAAFVPTGHGYQPAAEPPPPPLKCSFIDEVTGLDYGINRCGLCGDWEPRAWHHRAETLLEAARRCAQRGCTGKPRETIEGDNGRLIRCDKCGEPWQRSKKKRR